MRFLVSCQRRIWYAFVSCLLGFIEVHIRHVSATPPVGQAGRPVRLLLNPAPIRCDGEMPVWVWPDEIRNYGTLPSSPQQLCALTEYGGHPFINLGGYCEPRLTSSRGELWRIELPENQDRINFDTSRNPHPSQALLRGNDRAYHFCQLRCWCATAGSEHPLVQSARVVRIASERTVAMNLNNGLTWGPMMQPLSNGDGNSEAISIRTKAKIERSISRLTERYLSLEKSNTISCAGPAYPWPLPTPFQGRRDFTTLTGLCAAALSGGKNDGNAGGVCITPKDGGPEVSFVDEFTPHRAFQSTNFPAAWAVRVYCSIHCRCITAEPPPNGPGSPPKSIRFLADADYELTDHDLSITIKKGRRAGSKVTLASTNGVGSPGSPPMGTCINADGTKCLIKRPRELYNSLTIPGELDSIQISSDPGVCNGGCKGTCAASCASNTDCGGDDGDCRCVVPRSSRRVNSVEPASTYFAAVCIAAANYLMVEASLSGSRLGGLPRRSLNDSSSELGIMDGAICACNSTYISHSCCEASNGLIWEDPGRKLGVLADNV